MLIAAVARNGTIGADGGLPWHLPADLQRFKALTMGHPMVMGRRTFDSIGRALPGRRTIVVTRDPDWSAPGVEVAHSVDEAIDLALTAATASSRADRCMVVGGGEIYRQTIDRADRLELTHVDADVVGDTRFPGHRPGAVAGDRPARTPTVTRSSATAPAADPRPAACCWRRWRRSCTTASSGSARSRPGRRAGRAAPGGDGGGGRGH